jgi:GGDEF domain-containing protein
MRAVLLSALFTMVGLLGWAGLTLHQEQPIPGTVFGALFLVAGEILLAAKLRRKTPAASDTQRISQEADRGRRLAIYNPSTGLLAQWYFELRLDEELARAKRYELPLVVLTLSGSKSEAESGEGPFGPGANETSRIASAVVRRTDLVGSIGFSEYAICLLHCNRAGAVPFIRRLMEALGDGDWRLGLAVYPDDDYSGKELLELADMRSAPWRVPEPLAEKAA